MPEEHTGQLGFEYAWKELLARSRLSGKDQIGCSVGIFNLVCCYRTLHELQLFLI